MTSASVKINIVILWEHEIIIAAKALHKLTKKGATAEDYQNALKACYTAIYDPALTKNSPVTIMSANKLHAMVSTPDIGKGI